MIFRSQRYWTDDEIQLLELLWARGEPLNHIARVLNRSRGSVAGKVDRLGLCNRGSPIGFSIAEQIDTML